MKTQEKLEQLVENLKDNIVSIEKFVTNVKTVPELLKTVPKYIELENKGVKYEGEYIYYVSRESRATDVFLELLKKSKYLKGFENRVFRAEYLELNARTGIGVKKYSSEEEQLFLSVRVENKEIQTKFFTVDLDKKTMKLTVDNKEELFNHLDDSNIALIRKIILAIGEGLVKLDSEYLLELEELSQIKEEAILLNDDVYTSDELEDTLSSLMIALKDIGETGVLEQREEDSYFTKLGKDTLELKVVKEDLIHLEVHYTSKEQDFFSHLEDSQVFAEWYIMKILRVGLN